MKHLRKRICSNIEEAFEHVLRLITDEYKYTSRALILSKRRSRYIVDARQMLIYILYADYGFTCTAIGEVMHRTHTTILYASELVSNYIKYDKKVEEHYKNIKSKL